MAESNRLTAFRTISMRIRSLDEDTEELSDDLANISGDIADLTKTASNSRGVSIFTDATKQTYKSTYQILKEIAAVYNEISDKNQAELLEKLGGKRGGQVLSGLLTNFSAVEGALQNMEKAAGSADKEMGIVENSLDFKLNRLSQVWVGVSQNLIDRSGFGTVIDLLTTLSELIDTITGKAGLLTTAFTGIGAFLGARGSGLIQSLRVPYCQAA